MRIDPIVNETEFCLESNLTSSHLDFGSLTHTLPGRRLVPFFKLSSLHSVTILRSYNLRHLDWRVNGYWLMVMLQE